MRVYGITVSDEAQKAALDALPYIFKACDLVMALEAQGVRKNAAYRGADRMLQKLRKAGVIVWVAERKEWRHV